MRPSMNRLFHNALLPLGTTMYVWGGGWNEADTGAGEEALTLGISPRWAAFSRWQSKDYDFHLTAYQIHDGLDCSGYMGWLLYNTLCTPHCTGYVFSASQTACRLGDLNLGTLTLDEKWLPGDICSMPGHVWLCLGTCSDGSVLLLHSSPPGVRLCGTAASPRQDPSVRKKESPYSNPEDTKSQAVLLAEQILSSHYPDWYSRYPDCRVSPDYLTQSEKLRWHSYIFYDAKDWTCLSANQVADILFP